MSMLLLVIVSGPLVTDRLPMVTTMDHSHAVRLEASKYVVLKDRLLEEFPAVDEDTLFDTLEGITDLHEMIGAIIRSALVDQALQTGLRTRIEEMRQRLSRLAERGLKKR